MTMPSKVTVFWREGNLNSVATSEPHDSTGSAHYIRADIAEELARSLEALLDSPDQLSASDAVQALARFRKACENTA